MATAPQNAAIPPVPRAYTLRLSGKDPSDTSWRECLWKTHEAVNRGVQEFGDWLLTMRGGLCHGLADERVPSSSDTPDRDPTDQDRRDRRILLALSWLSVESPAEAAPTRYVVACLEEPQREEKVLCAFREILASRHLPNKQISEWLEVCRPCLSARIRKDAVWVNRSLAFAESCQGLDIAQARLDSRTVLWHLLGRDYLTLPRTAQKKKADETDEKQDSEEKREAAIKTGRGAGRQTRHLFSHLFGTSGAFGNDARLHLRDHWRDVIAERLRNAIPFRCLPIPRSGFPETELQREMFSLAASRLAQIHTKQKQQEVERDQRAAADEQLRRLESDASYHAALGKLHEYSEKQADATGTTGGEFLLRPRAITRWDTVVEAWQGTIALAVDTAEEERIREVKRLQDEQRDAKFGDVNLFIRLAAPEYVDVWWHNGHGDPSILTSYVKGTKARSDAERLKVSAYRHPDPFTNPVFCQFGDSRPPIKFARLQKSLPKSGMELSSEIRMRLWNGDAANDQVPLSARGKRLERDIGSIVQNPEPGAASSVDVPRRDRLGRSALGKPEPASRARLGFVFDAKEVQPRKRDTEASTMAAKGKTTKPLWNGTLSADRAMLQRLARLNALDPERAAVAIRTRLHWSLTVSLNLQPRGPWVEYAHAGSLLTVKYNRDLKRKAVVIASANSRDQWRGLAFPFWHPRNEKGRKGRAKHILSSLPAGLRILSVDLGHRHAAACAVWETLTAVAFAAQCEDARKQAATVWFGPQGAAPQDSLYAIVEWPERESPSATKKAKAEGRHTFRPHTLYRRIGPDTLPDGSPHPAPWARLHRQFLIKLQGEDKPARWATQKEVDEVAAFETRLGLQPAEGQRKANRVEDLMADALRTARLSLRRHGDCARTAWGVTTLEKLLPGARHAPMTPDERVKHLQDVLMRWAQIANSTRYNDDRARQLWKEWIVDRFGGPPLWSEPHVAMTRPARRTADNQHREGLKPTAEQLADRDNADIAALWEARWKEDDRVWTPRLRWLRNWLLPPAKRKRDKLIRNVGGLGLTRIASIKGLYQLLKSFRMRPEPDNPRKNVPELGDDSLRNFAKRILNAMERMRENRVKQLASRIAEAALGIGSEDRKHWEGGTKRPRQRIEEARFAPCHAVVIENLTHYRPEETRTRRENRGLMTWSAGKIKKFLAEACQLHGLHLREVSAAYTSRQDSRTGAPGVRCLDVALTEFRKQQGFWQGEIARARKRSQDRKDDARDRLLLHLDDSLSKTAAPENGPQLVLRIPHRGGDIFVSSDAKSPAAKGLQADLNAAANIGLKALMDPDWPAAWWYVACRTKDGTPVRDQVKGCPLFEDLSRLPTHGADAQKTRQEKRRGGSATNDIANLWRDPSARPLDQGQWVATHDYWTDALRGVVTLLGEKSGLPLDSG